jgi:ABC-type Fe3+ transport system substrate-binding protein
MATKLGRLFLALLIVTIVAVPLILRDKTDSVVRNEQLDTLVILTAHNEALRNEYAHGFKKWYKSQTGNEINLDWRYQGGGQETSRYIESMFSNNFMNYWTTELKLPWSGEHAAAFAARNVKKVGIGNALRDQICDTFVNSNIGCGVDILFGGGVHEFISQADRGNIVTCDIIRERPDLFSEDTIPAVFAGSRLWDSDGRWFGAALSSFGIICNTEALLVDGIKNHPRTWTDLAQPEYFRKLAFVDPSKSSSVLKALSMLMQQQMQISYDNLRNKKNIAELSKEDELAAVSEGWLAGLRIIQKIAANSRYFTESATKPIIDVSSGNCLAGIAVDFYGLSEEKHLEERSGSKRFRFIVPCADQNPIPQESQDKQLDEHGVKRFKFVLPYGGGAPSPDPIAVFRGAQRPDLAKKFIEYIVSIDGQKLLAFNAGIEGGPVKITMCRSPILKTVYDKKYEQFRANPDLNPYEATASFISHDEWTSPVFTASGMIIKLAFIDNNIELVEAWGAILQARKQGRMREAEAAEKIMTDMSGLGYQQVIDEVAGALDSKDAAVSLKYQNNLCDSFRKRYILAKQIAEDSSTFGD